MTSKFVKVCYKKKMVSYPLSQRKDGPEEISLLCNNWDLNYI